jgi:hypothetical protein
MDMKALRAMVRALDQELCLGGVTSTFSENCNYIDQEVNRVCNTDNMAHADVFTGHCFAGVGIFPPDTRDSSGKERFHQWWYTLFERQPEYLYEWQRDATPIAYREGADGISSETISMHGIKEPFNLFLLDYYFYGPTHDGLADGGPGGISHSNNYPNPNPNPNWIDWENIHSPIPISELNGFNKSVTDTHGTNSDHQDDNYDSNDDGSSSSSSSIVITIEFMHSVGKNNEPIVSTVNAILSLKHDIYTTFPDICHYNPVCSPVLFKVIALACKHLTETSSDRGGEGGELASTGWAPIILSAATSGSAGLDAALSASLCMPFGLSEQNQNQNQHHVCSTAKMWGAIRLWKILAHFSHAHVEI